MAEQAPEMSIELETKQSETPEVSGEATTNIAELPTEAQELPPLTYIDFFPQCLGSSIEGKEPQFAEFSTVIEQANQWLTSMPQFSVYKCETLDTRLGNEFALDADNTVTNKSSNGKNAYVRGLRLWLIPKQEPNQPVQQLAYVTVLPDHTSGNLKMFLDSLAGSAVNTAFSDIRLPNFDTLSQTVEKLNKHLGVKPLPGKILTVETVTFKAQESNTSDRLNSEAGAWSESGANARFYLYGLRIFYVLGQPAYETIGIYDEQPEIFQNMEGITIRLKFSTFNTVMAKATQWLQKQQGIRVVNLQTVNIKLERKYGSGPWVLDSESAGYTVTQTLNECRYTKILRIAYIRDQKLDNPSPYASITMTSRLFVPSRIEWRTFETFSKTMLKAINWLNATRIPLFACETVRYEFSIDRDGQGFDDDKTDTVVNTHTGQRFLTCIRLYFPSVFQEPPEEIAPPEEEGWGWYACVVS